MLKAESSASIAEAEETIINYLSTIPKENSFIEIGFFGGSFTGLPIEKQKTYLSLASKYLENKSIQGIRLSTRPDYISLKILELLKKYGVSTIELGVQSMNNKVLSFAGRGHTIDAVYNAVDLIKSFSIDFGLQMMVGLPEDTLDGALFTAKKIIEMGASNTRIYPVVVIKDTELEQLYNERKYIPLSLDEAVYQVKEVVKVFEKSRVKIIRMGLHPSEALIDRTMLLDGPFHISFGELVHTALWKEEMEKIVTNKNTDTIVIDVNPKQYAFVIGHKASNKNYLLKHFKKVNITTNIDIKGREYNVSYC